MEKTNLKNPFLEGILKKVLEEQRRIEKEQKITDKHYTKALEESIERESKLKAQLEKKYQRRDQFISEYAEIEKKVFVEAEAEIEADAITKEKVKKGEKSLADYFREGKDEKTMARESMEKASGELERALDVLRLLNAEILDLEISLAQEKENIFGSIMLPGRLMIEKLTKLTEFAKHQITIVTDGYPSASQELKNLKERQMASEGKFLTGYAWPAMTAGEARKTIPFDPVLPREFIPRFYEIIEGITLDDSGPHPEKLLFAYYHKDQDLSYRIVR